MENIEEYWVVLKDYPYKVSSNGNVKRLGGNKVLKPMKDKDGYLKVNLSDGARRKRVSIHRLVAIYFIPNIYNKAEVNHLDGDKNNNYLYNLEWCTRSENQIHAYKTGLQVSVSGENHWAYKGRLHTIKKRLKLTKNSYTQLSITRSNFKGRCKLHKWEFYHFIEKESNEYDSSGKPKFFYTEMTEDEKLHVKIYIKTEIQNDKYYSEKPITRKDFKKYCFRYNKDLNSFTEKYSGEKQGNIKKYFYYKII